MTGAFTAADCKKKKKKNQNQNQNQTITWSTTPCLYSEWFKNSFDFTFGWTEKAFLG